MTCVEPISLVDPIEGLLESAARYPTSIAVDEDGVLTDYAEFVGMVRRFAASIGSLVPGNNQPRILINLPRSAQAYAAMFGSLYAGGYYSPVNCDQPAAMQQRQLDRFEPDLIIGSVSGLHSRDIPVLVPEDLTERQAAIPSAPHRLAYVIFTSGSTGEPKGVMVGRKALAHYISWAQETIKPRPGDRWSQHPNLGFDLSVLDVYGALCGGGTLVPLNDRRDRLVPAEAIRKHRLTIWNSVPSVVDLMRRGGKMTQEALSSVRLMTFCGEPLLKEHLDAIFDARPDLTVFNTYGPTEATVSMTLLELHEDTYRDFCRENVSIGTPIRNMHVVLEGGDAETEGEMTLVGPQVAEGYWRNPELTEARFKTRTINGIELPAYLSGDWVNDHDGDLYFASRTDRQVKINGYRLELGAIEAALRESGAEAAAVIFSEGALTAFVESRIEISRLRAGAAELLPSFAIPHRFIPLEHLPRNANDKIDVKSLMKYLKKPE